MHHQAMMHHRLCLVLHHFTYAMRSVAAARVHRAWRQCVRLLTDAALMRRYMQAMSRDLHRLALRVPVLPCTDMPAIQAKLS